MGTVYLPALEAIASCGYNSVWDQDSHTDFPITRYTSICAQKSGMSVHQYSKRGSQIVKDCPGQVHGVLPH